MTRGDDNARLLRRATRASVGVALSLIVAKSFAYYETQSAAVLGALLDSCLDAIASVVNLFAVRHALEPADAEHRFGHGKAEPLAALGQALFITASAAFLVVDSTTRLTAAPGVSAPVVGIAVMVIAIIATGWLVVVQRRVIAATNSTAIRADNLHYSGDLFLHLGVITSLVLWLTFEVGWVDGAFGLAIAGWLLVGAVRVGWDAVQLLMDRELPQAERDRIVEIITRTAGADGVHELRTRRAGTQLFIQLHLELDGSLTLAEAHRISVRVERELQREFAGCDVLIHQDPKDLREDGELYD